MMKKWVLAVLGCVLLCMSGAAHALELPGIALFSPGLKRLAEMEKTQPNVSAEAQISIDKAMYARDLSLLGKMLEGTTISYQRSGEDEWIAMHREGEELGAYAPGETAALDRLEEKLLGTAILERVPLASVAQWLEGLQAGDALAFGFSVHTPFEIERTMSDDGTRLTKIRVSGAIAQEGKTPWKVSGYLRQPAGRAPKDTFEITFEQDENNTIELLYSALRENEVTRKNKEGTTSVRTTLKAAGKIAGSGISSRLSVTAKNRWSADGENLSERVTLSASLGHTDKTPGRRMQRLNDMAAETKHVIRLTTAEAVQEPIEMTDEITLSVTMDSNTFLSGSAEVRLSMGAQTQKAPENLQTMDEASAKALAKKLYRTLDEKTMNSLEEGL
ncbi:MAG: hypothetical protein IJ418_23160 [Clostridia bacterium]|nr:hypothetical protein [Clostridia bacterium]